MSETHGWVLGDAPCSHRPCTSMLRTRDGGVSWRGIPAPKAVLGNRSSSREGGVAVVRFADDSDGWAGVGDLYSTHDAGASWHEQHVSGLSGRVLGIETGGGYVYAYVFNCPSQGGSDCRFTSRMYASPIGSDHWHAVSPVLPGGGSSSALVVHGADWYLSTRGGIYHGHGTGAPSRIVNPCRSEQGSLPAPFVAAADSAHLDALCTNDGAAGSIGYQLYGTADGGRSWQRAGRTHIGPSGVFAITDNSGGVLLIAASSGTSELLRTTDDGTTLHRSSVSVPAGGLQWDDVGFTTRTRALAVLHSTGLYLSHDAGRTFQQVRF